MTLKDFYKYRDPRIIRIVLLGFSSGLPFLLLLSTLAAWLKQSGIDKATIGMFAWVTFPYGIKFLIAPFVDKIKIPFAFRILGKRRGWLLFAQVMLMVLLYALSLFDPLLNAKPFIIISFLIGVFAATQDIIIEAYRIESLPKRLQGYGSGAIVLGFRLGMLTSGSVALYLAHYFGWQSTYAIMSLLMIVGIIVTLSSPEPKDKNKEIISSSLLKEIFTTLESPIKEIYKAHSIPMVLIFILSFKIGDTVINTMSMPFLIELGFSNIDIANVAKTFGISSMIIGGMFGGVLISKNGLRYGLILSSILLIISSFMFAAQWKVGSDYYFLIVTMGFENFACGISQASLIAYLSYLCGDQGEEFTATKFALLSSFASISRIILSSFAGLGAEIMNWGNFYMLVAILCFIPLFIIIKVEVFDKNKSINHQTTGKEKQTLLP